MTTSHKFLVVQTEDWIVRIQKVRVENDFNTVRWGIEELNTSDLIQDGIAGIISHIMRRNRWK
jgi:glucokinase